MIFWIILGIIFAIAAFILISTGVKSYDTFVPFGLGLISAVLAIIFILCPIGSRYAYLQFENTFEIQKQQFNTLKISETKKYVYVMNIMEINEQLASYQGSRKQFGVFSNIPERVLCIEPIGLE